MTTTLAAALILSPAPASLRQAADLRRFDFGSCVVSDNIKNNIDGGKYVNGLKQTVNLIEPENDLKPAAMWKNATTIDFTKPDFLLGAPGKKGWAQEMRMKVRGHVLCYPNEPGYTTPSWLLSQESSLSATQVKDLLRNYVQTVARRYQGKIYMWDVMNEVISDSANGNQFNVRSSIWYRKLGMEFIPLCFKWAAEADPRAKLYYNDYGIETTGRKLDDTIAMCNWIRSQGGRVDGIGLQYHIGTWANVAPGSSFYQAVAKIEQNNYDWMVTELDYGIDVVQYPSDHPSYGIVPLNAADLTKQANTYKQVVTMVMNSRRGKGVNMWGFTDKHSWIPGFSQGKRGAALIYDATYAPKPAHAAVMQALSL